MNSIFKKHRLTIASVCFFLFSSHASALFEDLGMGARGPGMGNALTAAAGDVNAVHYNPAGLANLERSEITASHGILFMGLSDGSDLGLSNIAFAYPLSGEKAFAAMWNRLSLAGLYGESTLQFSYGQRMRAKRFRNLMFGASLKYLSHSFEKTDEAYDAMNGIYSSGEVDPVLVGENSKSAFDADLGILWEITEKYTFGLAVKNVLEPNMSFSGGDDPVNMKIRAGLSHKSLWMLLCGQLNVDKAPDGSMDKSFALAVERIFPSLDKGNIGARASFAMGDRDYKEISAGVSYKINKIGFDYGFSLPLGTVKDTAGNHKIAMNYYFGGPTVEEQYAMKVLEQFRELKKENKYTSTRDVADLEDKRLEKVHEEIRKGNYEKADTLMREKAKDLLPDKSALNLTRRISLVTSYYPSIRPKANPPASEKWLVNGIYDLLRGNDSEAIKWINFAQSMSPGDMTLNSFLAAAEEITHIKADRVPPGFEGDYIEYKFYESDLLYDQRKYKEAARKLLQVLEFEPENLDAIKKLGSCHYLMENYSLAISYWEKALKLETNTAERKSLADIINKTKRKAGSWNRDIAAKREETKTSKAAEIEKLYKLGADLYLRGEYGKAADTFRKILTIDPQNGRAKKALERILRLR